MTTKIFALSALFFYVLCWFADSPSKTIWYIGISLPWLSMFLSIPIDIIFKVRSDNHNYTWGYSYVVTTIVYVIAVSLMSGSIWCQMPHLATCVCFIAYFTLEFSENKEEDLKKKLHSINLSSEKALEELRHFDDLYPKTIKLNQILIDILNESEKEEGVSK